MTSRPCDLALLKCFDDVAGVQVLEVGEADAALEPGRHLPGVVLEAAQGDDGALPDDGAVAQEPHLGAAGDLPLPHVAPGDGAHPGDPEDLPHPGLARDHSLV